MGKLIVIDGVDGSGKTTQAQLLLTALKSKVPVSYFDFPQYDKSIFGKLVARCLNQEFGDFLKLSPYIASLPYMLDRASAKPNMIQALGEGHIICNRYTTSNIAHQSGKLPIEQRKDFIDFIETGEYGELEIPKPDCVIFLNVSVDTTEKLIQSRGRRDYLGSEGSDQSETDKSHQLTSAEVYQYMADTRSDWHVIECMESGELLSPEAIHQKVFAIVAPLVDLS